MGYLYAMLYFSLIGFSVLAFYAIAPKRLQNQIYNFIQRIGCE